MSDFWSRRRAAVEAEAEAETEAEAEARRAEEEAALAERSDEELLSELNLRDPDEMESPDEVQELLRSALPQRLKTRALRRLWRLNPVLANVDGLVDYGEDFTDAATVVENMQTAYQVGKGMLKALVDDTAEDPEDGDVLANAEADAEAEAMAAAEDAARDKMNVAAAEQAALATPPEPEMSEPSAPQRRMRFRFDTAS